MITKSIKKIFAISLLCCGATAIISACADWDDHYEAPASEAAGGLSLWQTMQQYSELSDFCEVLQKTEVYKNHRKTGVSYADLLGGSQTFTVLAPVNGTFNKDSLLDLLTTNRGDSMVERSFVGNHLSYSLGSSVGSPTELFLINTKRLTIADGKAYDVPLKAPNIKAKGGVLHILQSALPYRHNLYEVMLNNPRYSGIGEQLASYEKDEFLPEQSVEGGMVDGEMIYADSVFKERNILLESVGELAAEDSSYIFVVPEADEWQRVWEEAMGYFRFDETVVGGDSLQRLFANRALLGDAIFSRTIQVSHEDSLVTYAYNKYYPKYHVFHRPYEPGGILYGATPTDYSNGTLYTAPQWPFTPQMTYHREIKVEGEYTDQIVSDTLCTIFSRVQAADSISENGYLVINGQNMDNWRVTFKVENTLAGAYDICAIILPATVYTPDVETKPCRFTAQVNYVDEKGKKQSFSCSTFQNNPNRVDTLVLAENFVFPVCNYGETNQKISVELRCNIIAIQNKLYDRNLYLDCIYLRPRKSESDKSE